MKSFWDDLKRKRFTFMLSIKEQITIIKPNMSTKSIHDFVYQNMLIQILAYGKDNDAQHLTALYEWQQELAPIVNELAKDAKSKTETPAKK